MDYLPSTMSWNGQATDPDKSSRVMIRDYPHRAIAIVSHSHALIFRHSTSGAEHNGTAGAAKCMVEFSPVSKGMLSDYRPLTSRPIYGTLGLISINRDVFLCVITQAIRVATLRPGETIEMIAEVQFFCLNTNEYDDVLSVDPWDPDGDAASVYSQGLSRRDVPVEHPCQELIKLLGNRSFYYSTDFDLTNRLQDRSADASIFDIDNFDESFLWNSFMIQPLVQFRSRLQPHERDVLDVSRILTSAIRGFCLTVTIPQSVAPLRTKRSGMPSYLTVISRLSCRRAGTRFNARGIDDDGNVANFVETETIYWSPAGVVFSYVQIRGSVPIFWEQSPGLLPGHQKIVITRSPDGAQPAFDKHFEELEQAYGAVHVINLLSEVKPGEAELSAGFRYGLRHSPLSSKDGGGSLDHALLCATEYDFHAETKGPTGYEAAQEIRRYIADSADGFAYYMSVETDDSAKGRSAASDGHRRFVVVLQQEGVFRTNCLDCLDRTNLIQTIISQMAVEAFLNHKGEYAGSDFWVRHSNLWADNGDALSKIYAGTGALKSSFTRSGKMSLAGAIADARKSATRLYINNFADKGRQNTIDLLLGRLYGQARVELFDPIGGYVTAELNKRAATFSSTEVIRIWVGTFNLNGRTDGLGEDLSPWLCPASRVSADSLPEIVAVGFQEIVELSPQQIMNSDPTRKQEWESAVRNTLNKRATAVGGESYVLLRSGQLVGAALCIFAKASSLAKIKNVEGAVKKTGLSGMAGNKGAVAIRLDYASTPICFVTAHLAAGFANYEERNRDYLTIHHGLRFQRNRGIDDHDAVIWFGDFNYRIGLGRERAMELVRANDLESLYENDQLNLQMVAGLSFPYYSEARIYFPPTYKFDVGRDEYDSSEKQRIPAWTDRILRKGLNLRQTSYNSAPLRFSDHRPVYAEFSCTVTTVDEAKRDKISQEVYERRKMEVGDVTANTLIEDTDDEDLIGYDAIEPGLPAASSDRHKWWLDNGKMAQATVQPPAPAQAQTSAPAGNGSTSSTATAAMQATVLNPNRASNPFVPSDEPDWVAVPRSRLSSFSSLSTSPYEQINHSTVLPAAHGHGLGQGGTSVAASRGRPGMQFESAAAPPPPPPRRQTGNIGKKTASSSSLASAHTANTANTAPAAATTSARSGATVSAVARAFEDLQLLSSPAAGAESHHHGELPAKTPPQLPARSMSATSSASSSAQPGRPRAAPPPVAKKPARLTAAATLPTSASASASASAARPIARRRTDQMPMAEYRDDVEPPRLPPHNRTIQGDGRGGGGGGGVKGAKGGSGAAAVPANFDLLSDSVGSDLSRWQPLQPS